MVDAGWFTDPESTTQLRWWDGERWTEHRQAAIPPAAVVAPPIVPHVSIPPVEPMPTGAYPAPAPLATTYPPPGAADGAPVGAARGSASAFAATESYWQTPEPQPHSSRNLLLAVLIPVGTLILILIVFIAVNVSEAGTVATPKTATVATSTPTATPIPGAATPDINQPGMVGVFNTPTAGGETTTAAAAFADESSHYANLGMDARCAPLAFGVPVDGTSADAPNFVQYYSNFVSPSGGTSMSGTVQVFASAAQVRAYESRLEALLHSCDGGFSDGDGTDKVGSILLGSSGDGQTISWNQVVTTSSASYTVHDTEWRNGPIVARAWCYQLNGTADASTICSQWANEVQFAVKNSH